MDMTYCVYVDGEEEESGLSKDEAISLEDEVLEEDPEAIVTIEPELETEDGFEDTEEEGEELEED